MAEFDIFKSLMDVQSTFRASAHPDSTKDVREFSGVSMGKFVRMSNGIIMAKNNADGTVSFSKNPLYKHTTARVGASNLPIPEWPASVTMPLDLAQKKILITIFNIIGVGFIASAFGDIFYLNGQVEVPRVDVTTIGRNSDPPVSNWPPSYSGKPISPNITTFAILEPS